MTREEAEARCAGEADWQCGNCKTHQRQQERAALQAVAGQQQREALEQQLEEVRAGCLGTTSWLVDGC